MDNATLSLVSAFGMMAVAIVAVTFWRRVSGTAWTWFSIGAALWTVAVVLKMFCAVICEASPGNWFT